MVPILFSLFAEGPRIGNEAVFRSSGYIPQLYLSLLFSKVRLQRQLEPGGVFEM
jgi:hypothetical protein